MASPARRSAGRLPLVMLCVLLAVLLLGLGALRPALAGG